MKRGTFLLGPCLVAILFIAGCSHCKPYDDAAKGPVAVTAFVLHFEQRGIDEGAVRAGLGAPWYDSLVGWPQVKSGAVFEYAPLRTETFQTAAEAFNRAYEIQDKTGAWRVEPMFEMPPPIERGNPLADEKPAQEALDDDDWSLKQIRAEKAWERIRSTCGGSSPNCDKGWEAFGVSIAHLDTGYTRHPENWQFMSREFPILDVARGHDYCDNDDDPKDELPNGLLDFPGHGTGSSSVIVSPEGCQLQGDKIKCVSGVARGAQIVPLRVNTSVIVFNPQNLARAIQDVADGKIKGSPRVISIAMGGFPSVALESAVKNAEDKGILVITASGNNIGIVVWPAQYPSVIAVAATNVHCQPWEFSSCGPAVAISAPGESVWRAQLDKKNSWAYINSMSSGTTFATGHTAGAAALWMVRHRVELDKLREQKKQHLITEAFRYALKASAWRPRVEDNQELGTSCTSSSWDDRYGPGILNTFSLLEVPLDIDKIEQNKKARQESEQLPLFSSLYRFDADKKRTMEKGRIERDYQSLFESREKKRAVRLADVSRFETEIMYQYTMNAKFRQVIDVRVRGEKRDLAAPPVQESLPKENLSATLRDFLAQ